MDTEMLSAMRHLLQEELNPIKSEISKLHEETRQTRVLVEHQDHNISLIAEQYGDISKKLERVREIDELRDRVRILERVISAHTDQIKLIQKAQ